MAKSSGRKRSPAKRSSSRGAAARPLWPWLAALVVTGGGIYLHDSGLLYKAAAPASAVANRTVTASIPVPEKPPAPVKIRPKSEVRPETTVMNTMPVSRPPVPPAVIPVALPARPEPQTVTDALDGKGYSGKFYLCGNDRKNDCVIDGGTFRHRNARIRLVDVEMPRIDKPGCDRERNLASDAEQRLWQLLDSGPFDLATWPNHDRDSSGAYLRVVLKDGHSIGDILAREGLARKKGAPQKPWC